MVSANFQRGLDDKFVEQLNRMYRSGGWWKQMVDDNDLFLAIRKNYINVYFRGASVLKLSWATQTERIVGRIHYKYLVRPEILDRKDPYVLIEDGNVHLPERESLFFNNINDTSLVKRTAKRYVSEEKSSVHHIALNDSNNVFDLEVAFADDNDTSAPRMDLVTLQPRRGTVEIVFFEAKEFSNFAALRKSGDSDAEVVTQIEKYSRILKGNCDSIVERYMRVCKNLFELRGLAKRFPRRNETLKGILNGTTPLIVNEYPRLLITGCDRDQKKGNAWRPHRDKLERSLEGRVRIAKSGKNIKLDW